MSVESVDDDGPVSQEETGLEEEQFSLDEIEAAYQRALEISEHAELDFPELEHLAGAVIEQEEDAVTPSRPVTKSSSALIQDRDAPPEPEQPQLSLMQIVEAFLFVGGEGLTLKRMAGFLNQDGRPEVIEQAIADLNELYEQQLRPYRIDLQEGGYHLKLLYEYEPIRNRVYGLAPKEVRLSQEVIEVLSFIAYKQPVSLEQIKALEHESSMSCLKQLMARDLVTTTEEAGEERYVTTARFLQVFGIANLKELPRPESLDYK